MIYLVLAFGVAVTSSAVILIKLSEVHPVLLVAYRCLLASAFLAPLFLRQWRRHRAQFEPRLFLGCVAPPPFSALHFTTWAAGARLTPAANASLIVNMAPLAMPFLLYALSREIVTRREILGTAVALSGVLVLAGGDFVFSRENLLGNAVCFSSMILFAAYLALGRKNRTFPGIWLYLTPVFALSGLFCFVVSLFATDALAVLPPREYAILVALAAMPTLLGHSILNYALKRLRGQIVTVCNLGQFISAGLIAAALFGERPSPTFYPASALVVGGAVLAICRPGRSRTGRAGSASRAGSQS